MKHHIFSALVLSFPDLQNSFEIDTDASDFVLGIFLTQHGHSMAYHSETLSDTVYKYPIMKRKCIPLYKLIINGNITFWERR
jgi:hypothetical protein